MRVLLLGGKGYVGCRLHPYLSANDHNVTTYDLCWFGDHTTTTYAYKDFNLIPISELLTYDAVILLAGHSSVKMCLTDHQSSFNNNVRNFMTLLHKLERIEKSIKFIYASSSSVYGNTLDKLADESQKEFVCVNNYDLSKYSIDQYMLNNNPIDEWYGLRFGTINGYSKNFRSELMLNSMTRTAMENGEVQITNKHIHRAILDLNDLCRAVNQILLSGSKEKSGVYNINSFNSTVDKMASEVSRITKTKVVDNGNIGNPYDFMISNKKFADNFNFEFQGTVEKIVTEIKKNYGNIVSTNRDKSVKYD